MNNYKLIFWQTTISPHQSSFLRSLATLIDLTLVVENESLKEREIMGWTIPDLGQISIIVKPDFNKIDLLLSESKDYKVHIFSGIYKNSCIRKAYKKAILYNCRLGIMAEPYNWIGFGGLLRSIREKINYVLYGKRIDFFLAIGSKAMYLYNKAGYGDKIFEWGYFAEELNNGISIKNSSNKEMYDILYVGRLVRGKGIRHLIKALALIKNEFSLKIIGEGTERAKLSKLVERNDLSNCISFFNFIPNSMVRELIKNCDLLVLPSTRKDGWGVVINEALMEGTPVICSNYCGGSIMLQDPIRGGVFPAGKIKCLSKLLNSRIKTGKTTCRQRKMIKEWAMKNITGEIAAEYFIKIIEFVYNNASSKPKAPWI